MNKAFLFTLLFILIPIFLNAQLTRQWESVIGGEENEVIVDIIPAIDGGVIVLSRSTSVTGDFADNHGMLDGFLSKYDEDGNKIWHKFIGGSSIDQVHNIIAYDDQSYLISCNSTSIDGDVPPDFGSAIYFRIWLLKIDLEGNIIWDKIFQPVYAIRKVQLDEDGNIIMLAVNNLGLNLIKLDKTGETLWEKIIQIEEPLRQSDFVVTPFNHIAIFRSEKYEIDWRITILDESGNLLSDKSFGGSGGDFANRIIYNSFNSSYIITGETSSSDGVVPENFGGSDVFIAELNLIGDIMWSKVLGGPDNDKIHDLLIFEDRFLISGSTNSVDGDFDKPYAGSDVYLAELDLTGESNWIQYFGGNNEDVGARICLSENTNIFLAFTSQSDDIDLLGNHGERDVFLTSLEYDPVFIKLPPLDHHSFKVWPNPSMDFINIEWPTGQDDYEHKLIIRNALGQLVASTIIVKEQSKLNISSLPSGMYSCELYLGSALKAQKNILKQ